MPASPITRQARRALSEVEGVPFRDIGVTHEPGNTAAHTFGGVCFGEMPAVTIRPMKLPGKPWADGYVLDYHTVSSTPTGDPYYRFDTKRTELGERLFQLKYRRGGTPVLIDIVDTVQQFLDEWRPPVECVVPASLNRSSQPVIEMARELAKRLGLPIYEDAVKKVKPTPQMKNIDDWSERQSVLRSRTIPAKTES